MRKTQKKKQAIARIGLALVAALGGLLFALPTRPAAAACATPQTNYGSAMVKISVDTAGEYRLWTHLMAPDATNNSLFMEIDGGNCYVVGDSAISANAWTWVNHQNGSTASRITATLSKGTHTIKLIGREPNVKVDRVLAVSDQNCTPANLGENCMTTADTTKPTVSITSPADGSTVSGSAAIKATATDNTGVSKVEFYIQDKLVATDTAGPYEYAWDVSSLANGTYTVTAKAFDAAGNSSVDSEALMVQNGDTTPPNAPANITAKADSPAQVTVAWGAVQDAAKYRVLRDNVVIATVTGTSYVDTTVVADTSYSYSVVAVDASNNASLNSTAAQVKTPKPSTADTTPPTTPTDLVATAQSEFQINIAWKASTDQVGIKEYDIYRNSDEDKTFRKVASTTGTSYGDGGVYDNTTFTYYVIARDAAGNSSAPSDKAAARTPSLAERKKATLRGTVQGQNGRPLSGVKVTIWVGEKRYQTTTNWRGRYIISDIPAGRYEVSYRKDGYNRHTDDVSLQSGKTKWEDVTLSR